MSISSILETALNGSDVGTDLWGTGASAVSDAQSKAVTTIMDAIIRHSSFRQTYETVMLSSSASQAIRSQSLRGKNMISSSNQFISTGLTDVVSALGSITGLLDIALVTNSAVSSLLSIGGDEWQDLWEKACVMPNIEGVPISTESLVTSRQADVGEQVMIVQSSKEKAYWTDNSVPRLREYQLDGYITTSLALDDKYLIKPSLKMQANFLDTCTTSRRPVLFKDNRGEFVFVQIMNLQMTEDPSYNNAIKVSISMREYKPYTVTNSTTQLHQAISDPGLLS